MALLGYVELKPIGEYIPVYDVGVNSITDPKFATIRLSNFPILDNTIRGIEPYENSGPRFHGLLQTVLKNYPDNWIDVMYGGSQLSSKVEGHIPGLVRRKLSTFPDKEGFFFGKLEPVDWFGAFNILNTVSIEVIIAPASSYGAKEFCWFARVPGGKFSDFYCFMPGYGYWMNLVHVTTDGSGQAVITPINSTNYEQYLYLVSEPPTRAEGVSLTKPGPNSDDELSSLTGYWTKGTVELNRGQSYTIEARILPDLLDRDKDIPWEKINFTLLNLPGVASDIPLPLTEDSPYYEIANRAYSQNGNTITIGTECNIGTFTLKMSLSGVEISTEFPNELQVRFNIPDNLGPYNPDGTTRPGQEGGDGMFGGNINDQIESPDGSAEGPDGAGLYTRYLVTNSTMSVFGDWLWTEDLGLAAAKAAVGLIYGSPADTLISLVSYPFSVGAVAGTGTANVKWGGFDTGITWPTLASNAGTINWGSLSINKFWGNFLDYSPHTKIELYLPWGTGFVEIDTNQVMEGSINVKTNIEFAKGTCVHLVYNHKGSLIGSYSATVGKSLPITASDFASKQIAVAGAAIGLAVGATISAGAGVSAGIEGAGQVSYHNIVVPGRAAPITRGSISGFDTTAASGEFARTLPNAARPALQAAAASTRMPASYHRSGSFQEGSAGLGVQYPFIILSRPKQSMPQSYGHYYGYPCNKVISLGGCFGYTEVAEVHLDGVPATDAELIEIDRLLKGGVIL